MRRKAILMALLLATSVAYAGVLDDFNRANAPTLGAAWTAQSGNGEIYNNTARALNGWQQTNLLTYNGFSANTAFVDVYDIDGSLSYIALVLAYADVNNNYFIKVQDQGGGGAFNHAAFYYGNNGGGNFFLLDSAFTSGHIWASYTGTLASLWIDSNFDGIAEQFYSYNYGGSTGGNGIGLGLFGTGQADNFGSGAVPEPSSLLLLGSGLSAAFAAVRRRMR